MGKIHRLESTLVDQIAAGEVVERPASVVKELVENALDAGARNVHIDTEGAGLDLIRVSDDGEGIAEEDLSLALERHATSKVRSASDLERIRTLGFRGEALPSIAAVSRLRLSSRARRADSGAEIESRAGRAGAPRPCPHPPGTRVEVRDLFHNTPARRKFLRTPAGESRAIAALVSQFALAHPAVRFALRQDARALLDAPPARDLRERAVQVLGAESAGRLLDFEAHESAALRVWGLVSDPEGARGNRAAQWLFVNGRLVRDRALSQALQEAASEFIPHGRHAMAVVFVEVPPEEVDVNVHPAKWEVRFARPNAVRSVLVRGVREAARTLMPFRSAPWPLALSAPAQADALRQPPGESAPPPLGAGGLRSAGAPPTGLAPALPALGEAPAFWPAGMESLARPLPLGAGGHPEFLRPLAQYRESFILATDGSDLLIVDQHAAHERILYERFLRAWEEGKLERQPLLLSQPVSLSPEELVTLEVVGPVLERAGFRLERQGEREVVLRQAPVTPGAEGAETLVRVLLAEGAESRSGGLLAGLRERVAAGTACQAAIKIHTPLTREKMETLLRQLLETRVPFLCPHGRPVVLRLGQGAMERAFGRC